MKLKLLIILAIATALSPGVLAAALFHREKTADVIFTLYAATPNGQQFFFEQGTVFVGSSTSAPCSDLHFKRYIKPNFFSNGLFVFNGANHAYSKDATRLLGPDASCARIELIKNGIAYSTGNVKLVWDKNSNTYRIAKPRSVSRNFR